MATNLYKKRWSSSPLIHPAGCCLVLIAPSTPDPASMSPHVHGGLYRNLAALTTAANILSVPVFVSSPGPGPKRNVLVEQLPVGSSHRQFLCDNHGSPWLNADFVDKLGREDRSILIIAGFWLEHQVLATALHALAEAYDVYIPFDLAPAQIAVAAKFSRERLIQAGGTPVVTSQVIHEWSLETADFHNRPVLSSLLASVSVD